MVNKRIDHGKLVPCLGFSKNCMREKQVPSLLMVLDWMILKVWLNLRKPLNINCTYNESVDESFEYAIHEVMLSKKEEKKTPFFVRSKTKKVAVLYYGMISCK